MSSRNPLKDNAVCNDDVTMALVFYSLLVSVTPTYGIIIRNDIDLFCVCDKYVSITKKEKKWTTVVPAL